MRAVLLVCSLLVACGASASMRPPAVVAPEVARIGDRTTCLVSGEVFTINASSPKVEYRGHTYYFCCAGCDTDFAANPEKFLSRRAL